MLFRIFLGLISSSPLFFGANRAWSWSLYGFLIALIGVLYFVNILINKNSHSISIRPIKYPMIFATIPVIWVYLQTVSWLPSEWFHPFWAISTEYLSEDIVPAISLSPVGNVTALMKLLSYFLVFFLSFQFNRQSNKAHLTFNVLAYTGAAYALYGLIAFWGGYQTLFGFDNTAYQGSVRSTFVNRNSYATYAGLTMLCLIPMLVTRIKGSLVYGVKTYYGIQYFIEHFIIRAWLPILILLGVSASLFMSNSRGGFLSTLFAVMIFFIISVLANKLKKSRALSTLLLGMLVVGGSFWASSDKLLDRMDYIHRNDGRLSVYTILDEAILENPWLGLGYGSFGKSFRLYRDETVRGHYAEAHNTYLENMFELGMIPSVFLFIAILLVAIRCLKGGWLRKKIGVTQSLVFLLLYL